MAAGLVEGDLALLNEDLLFWDEVQDLFDPDLMGALPDLFVPDASVADW
ncbi:hypothetical protein Franean1_0442 [Parafrankia sp. EAN1pec]|nr:hypothetical protein Franean1_0442 [Frankia sp. EAN1pec]